MTPIKDLRPADDTADAVRDALARIADDKGQVAAEILDLRGQRATALLEGTASDIKKIVDTLAKLDLHVEQRDALEKRLGDVLLAREQAEFEAALAAQRQVIAAADVAFSKILDENYARAVDLILPILAAEDAAIAARTQMAILLSQHHGPRSAGVVQLAGTMRKSFMHFGAPGLPFAMSIKLPNTRPGRALWNREQSPAVPAPIRYIA